jgi:hypothetical protein
MRWGDDTAAALATSVTGLVLPGKNVALEKAFRHFGLSERDNAQRVVNVDNAQWDCRPLLREQARGTISPGILSYTRLHRTVRTRHCVSNVTFSGKAQTETSQPTHLVRSGALAPRSRHMSSRARLVEVRSVPNRAFRG